MYLVLLTALTAVCSAEKLDRTYLPPATAKTAGGSPGSLLTPFSDYYQAPAGSYDNGAQGVVVDAAFPGTRASLAPEETGLGGPRTAYGSTASKVGEAAFKSSVSGFNQFPTFKSIPLEDQDPEYQISIPKEKAIQTKLLQPEDTEDHKSNALTYENNVDIHKHNYAAHSGYGEVVGEKGVAHGGEYTHGGFSYKGDDRNTYQETYTANKVDNKPHGEHLLTQHSVSEDSQKHTEKYTKETSSGVVDNSSYDTQKYNTEGDYKESDTNKSNTHLNGASLVQNLPVSGFSGNSGSASSSYNHHVAQAFANRVSNLHTSQSKPSTVYNQGTQGNSAGFGQILQVPPSSSQSKPTGSGPQYTQEGLKPQLGLPTLSHFGAFPTVQPTVQGQHVSKYDIQTSQIPEFKPVGGQISSQYNKNEQTFTSEQRPQEHQHSQLNNHTPNLFEPAQNIHSKPFVGSFESTTSTLGQVSQTGSIGNTGFPPSTSNTHEKPVQSFLPHKTSFSPTSIVPSKSPVEIPYGTTPHGSQPTIDPSSVPSSATATGTQPAFGFQTPQVTNIYKQPSKFKTGTFTETTNNKFTLSQEHAESLHQSGQKYPQFSGSHNSQPQKSYAETLSSSSGSSLSTQPTANQLSSGATPTTGQVSQFSNTFSNTPVTTPGFSPTSPSFTSSSSPSYKPVSGSYPQVSSPTSPSYTSFSSPSYKPPTGLSIPQTQPSQQFVEKNKFTQSSSFAEMKPQSELFQNKPSITQNVFSTQLPVDNSQQSQGVDHSYYYNQPGKPFSTTAAGTQVSTFPPSNSGQYLQSKEPSNLSEFLGAQKGQTFVSSPVANTPAQAQVTPTAYIDIKPSQPSYVSVTPRAPAPLPSDAPKLPTLSPLIPVQQSFSQSTTVKKPTTSEVSQSVQSNVNTLPANNKPSGISQNYTPQSSQSQQYNGQVYEYNKPGQELSVTTNKDSTVSGQKLQYGQIQSAATSTTFDSQQSQKETTTQLETAQIGQLPLSQQGNTQFPSTPVTSQEQSKPGFTQFGSQPLKPFGSTSQIGSQPSKPFTTQFTKPFGSTSQTSSQPSKLFGSTSQTSVQPSKPFENTNQSGTQTYKPFGSSTQSGAQTYKPFGSTTQAGTQTYKPFGSTTQFGTQKYKPFGSSTQVGTQSYKPFGIATQLGAQPVKTTGSSFQIGTQSTNPFGTNSQFNSQQTKPSGSTSQSGTQSYKPFGSTYKPFGTNSQFNSQQDKPSGSTSQSGTQSYKPFGSTYKPFGTNSQFNSQQAKPSGSTSQSGTQSYKPFESTYKPFGGTPLFGSQTVKEPTAQQQQSFHVQTQTSTVPAQSGPQPAKPVSSLLTSATPQAQIGGQTTKPQFIQDGATSSSTGTVATGQLGTQPEVSQPTFGTAQTTKPQFIQEDATSSSTGTVATGQLGTQPEVSQPTFGTAQTTSTQIQEQHNVLQPLKPAIATPTREQQTTQLLLATQSKPQFGQALLESSNYQQQSVPQSQSAGQTYKPSSTLSTSSSGSSLTQTQSELQAAKPYGTSEKGSTHVGGFNAFPSSQTFQGTAQVAESQSSKPQFGSEFIKPVTTAQTQQQQTTKYEYESLAESQGQQTVPTNQQQSSNAFGSQAYKPIESSTPFNFGVQQTKNNFAQNAFPVYGNSQATASASSQPLPGFQFNSQPFGNTYPSGFKTQFGQNFLTQNTAFASATSGPEPYEYNQPTVQPFIQFNGEPYKTLGGSSTPVFPSVQPQFVQQTTPSYGGSSTPVFPSVQPQLVQQTTPSYTQKQPSFETAKGSSSFGQSFSSQFNSQTVKPLSPSLAPVIPQALPSKPESGLTSACCKATQLTQSNQSVPSSSNYSQTSQGLTFHEQQKVEESKGEKFNGPKQPQRFDEKTGYYYK